jgi:hypothetical protein
MFIFEPTDPCSRLVEDCLSFRELVGYQASIPPNISAGLLELPARFLLDDARPSHKKSGLRRQEPVSNRPGVVIIQKD